MKKRTFLLNKLVRDSIVDRMLEEGQEPDFHTLDGVSFLASLRNKILEEIGEVPLSNADEALKELADVQEALDALVLALGKSKNELMLAQKEKNQKRGAFTKRLFVETVTVPAESAWVTYYINEPDRFPEVLE